MDEIQKIINEGRPDEPKGSYTFAELASVFTGYCYKWVFTIALTILNKNRLRACYIQTPEETERESTFVVPFVKEHHRQPTFSDAIEITRKQMIDKIVKWLDDNAFEYVKTKTFGINDIYKGFDSERMITDLIKAMEE